MLFSSSVVREENSPRFEVGDGPFDDVSDLVDLLVEFSLPVKEVAIGWFLDGRDHAKADVSFVANEVSWQNVIEDPNLAQCFRIVSLACHGVGDVPPPPVQVGDDLNVESGRVVLARVEFR